MPQQSLQDMIDESVQTGRLDVSEMELTSLPPLPHTLTYLDCSDNLDNNRLEELPQVPANLTTFSHHSNLFASQPPALCA